MLLGWVAAAEEGRDIYEARLKRVSNNWTFQLGFSKTLRIPPSTKKGLGDRYVG